jgi:hypothetical protein
MKSSTILASALALIPPTLAAPTGETSGTLVARDNAKLNQYNHPDWYMKKYQKIEKHAHSP